MSGAGGALENSAAWPARVQGSLARVRPVPSFAFEPRGGRGGLDFALRALLGRFDDAGCSDSARGSIAIVLWWAILLLLAFRLIAVRSLPRAAFAAGGLLAAFALWTLASMLWAPSAEEAFAEFNRVTLYLGAFLLVLLLGRRASLRSLVRCTCPRDRRNFGRSHS